MTAKARFAFYVGQTDDGEYIACSEHEPLFCFTRDTEDEVLRIAIETFADYLKRFEDKTDVKLQPRPISEPRVRRIVESTSYELRVG